MTDQELLEYAAKAVELVNPRYVENTSWGTGISHGDGDEAYVVWNPLISDADAFRLAVRLAMEVDFDFPDGLSEARAWVPKMSLGYLRECPRRAIVEAAAEIGRNMAE